MTVVTPFPYIIRPMNNLQPFTYQDGETYLRILEKMRVWLNNSLVPELDSYLTGNTLEFQAGIANAEQTVTDAQAGWQAAFDTFMGNITNEIALLNADAVAGLITGPGAARTALDAILDAEITAVDTALRAYTDTLGTTLRGEADATETSVRADFAAADAVLLEAIADLEDRLNTDPLAPWKTAVHTQATTPAVLVSLGDSIAVGGNYSTESRAWFHRLAALYGPRGILRLDDVTLVPAPASGVQFYSAALGGKSSANYLTDQLVTRIQTLQPDLITHMVGTNDYAQGITPAAYGNNIKTRVDQIRAISPNTVHLFIHVPQRIDGLSNGLNWADYGTQLRTLAASYGDGAAYLDVDAVFRGYGAPGTTDRNKFWDPDNLHFNDAGNKAMLAVIGDTLDAPEAYLEREIIRATNVPPATATTNMVVSSLTIKPKPYLREGVVHAMSYAGATSGTGDLQLRYTPVGVSQIVLKSARLNPSPITHNLSMYLTLEPHTEYTVDVYTDVYSTGTITFGGSGPYYSLLADISPA